MSKIDNIKYCFISLFKKSLTPIEIFEEDINEMHSS